MKIFICTNDNQMIGAKVAKNTIINKSQFSSNDVVILSESEIPSLKRFFMKPYLRWGKMVEFNKNDIKSSLEDIKLNFDGTPVSWVIKINIKDIAISEETFREQLFNEGFQTLINNEFVLKTKFETILILGFFFSNFFIFFNC